MLKPGYPGKIRSPYVAGTLGAMVLAAYAIWNKDKSLLLNRNYKNGKHTVELGKTVNLTNNFMTESTLSKRKTLNILLCKYSICIAHHVDVLHGILSNKMIYRPRLPDRTTYRGKPCFTSAIIHDSFEHPGTEIVNNCVHVCRFLDYFEIDGGSQHI